MYSVDYGAGRKMYKIGSQEVLRGDDRVFSLCKLFSTAPRVGTPLQSFVVCHTTVLSSCARHRLIQMVAVAIIFDWY